MILKIIISRHKLTNQNIIFTSASFQLQEHTNPTSFYTVPSDNLNLISSCTMAEAFSQAM